MWLAVPLYFISTVLYFELINKIDQHLRDQGIYLEFGHASLLLVLLGFLCLAIAVINVGWAVYKRNN
jgi:hypothetical protein